MAEVTDELAAAFDDSDYDLGEVSRNRRTVRVTLHDEADAEALRSIVEEAIGAEGFFGFNVSTELHGGQNDVTTVVTFQQRE